MRLKKEDFNIDKRPALRVEDLAGSDAAVLTISGVRSGNIPDQKAPGGSRFTVRLSVDEFPDHQFYVNPAGVTALIENYGEEDTDWVGHVVPLVVKQTINPISGRAVEALHVAPLNEWKGIISGDGDLETEEAKPPARKNAAKKTTTRRK